jgi:hypothetical protein
MSAADIRSSILSTNPNKIILSAEIFKFWEHLPAITKR